ncbi:MAG: ABC transporter ATP-binding protein [Bdellovibrionia bacterium]
MGDVEKILEVKNLTTSFRTRKGLVHAVDRVSFDVYRGKTLGIVGESGCGKSVTSLSILRLIARPPGEITAGEILYRGRDLLQMTPSQMREIRGNEISMIFQEPMTSLNPVFTIGSQIGEAIALHQRLGKKEVLERTLEMLQWFGIPDPGKRIHAYPHQLSGGMRQRVMIAMALSCHPQILIADEPTTALDVTIQAQILELLKDLQRKVGLALILITHDLGVIAEMADEVLVMYAGQVVEHAPVREIFKNPKMPYTQALLRSHPASKRGILGNDGRPRLQSIAGVVPELSELPTGCRFQGRCSKRISICGEQEPILRPIGAEQAQEFSSGIHHVRCWRDE